MTTLQKLQVRQSEIRQKINEFLGNDSRSETETTALEALTAEGQKLEPEIRAAIIAAPDPETTITKTGDSETRERAELRSKTGIADFLRAAAGGAAVTGAAAEYAESLGIPSVGHLPMALLERTTPTPETRGDHRSAPPWTVPCSRQCRMCSSEVHRPASGSLCRASRPARYRSRRSRPRHRLTHWRRTARLRRRLRRSRS